MGVQCCDSIPDLSTGGKGEASNHFPSFILACRCHTTSQDTAPQRMWGSTLFPEKRWAQGLQTPVPGELAARRRSAPAVFLGALQRILFVFGRSKAPTKTRSGGANR